MTEETISVNLTPEWKLAQIKMLETSALQALNGLTNTDEDYHDTWEAGIPTELKLQLRIMGRDGERTSFVREWDALTAGIQRDDSEAVRRRRILRKRQLIVDLLHELKVWMRWYADQEPEEDGAFFQPFGGKSRDARPKPEP